MEVVHVMCFCILKSLCSTDVAMALIRLVAMGRWPDLHSWPGSYDNLQVSVVSLVVVGLLGRGR